LSEESGQLYVSDRQNGRVQVFTMQGDPLWEIKSHSLFQTVYSAHFCPAHGLFFIPGTASSDGREINAYFTGTGKNIQYSFGPESDAFKRPHVIRVKAEDVWIGEIDESGGILWHFEIQTEEEHHPSMPMPIHEGHSIAFQRDMNSMFPFPSSSMSGIDREGMFAFAVQIFFIGLLILTCISIIRCCYRWATGKEADSPQDAIDRKGFKPLNTHDLDSSGDESAEEDLVLHTISNQRKLESIREANNGSVF